MIPTVLRAPRAPTEQLCLESTKTLAKLQLIVEFKHWLDRTRDHLHRNEPPFKILFDCFALGASLGVLLDLMGSPAPSHLSVDVETFDFDLDMPDREKFFASFIQRVHFLEVQGKLRYGEVLRIEDLFGGTSSGFMKVLKTVQRLLDALQATYPGLYEFPNPTFTQKERHDIIFELVDTERAHVSYLQMILDSAATLSCASNSMQSILEPLVINDNRLRQYHDAVLEDMEALLLRMERSDFNWNSENWLKIFGFDNSVNRTNIAATYRSLSVNYLDLFKVLQEQMKTIEPALTGNIQIVLDVLSILPARIADYCTWLQAILDCTLPSSQVHSASSFFSSPNCFDSVCTTLYHMSQISSAINEMSWQIRSMKAAHILKQRAFHWNKSIDPAQLGNLLVDDQLKIHDETTKSVDTQTYQVFLFETMLLCCVEEKKPQKHGRAGSRSNLMGKNDVEPQKTAHSNSWASWTEWTRSSWSSWVKQRDEDGGQTLEMTQQQQQQNGNGRVHTNTDTARNPEADHGSRKSSTESDGDEGHSPRYPIRAWELGPALRRKTPLNLVYAIPTALMKVLRIEEELLSLDWKDNTDTTRTLKLSCSSIDQSDQWLSLLEGFVDEVLDDFAEQYLANLHESLDGTVDEEHVGIDILDADDFNLPGRRYSRPRPWSLIGRKGPYSESSSLHQQKLFESTELLLSPDMLPELFSPKSHRSRISVDHGSMSPLALVALEEHEHVRDSGVGLMSPLELPPLGSSAHDRDSKAQRVTDLTGRVGKIGGFPEGYGGFADVWKGVLKERDGYERTVAIKVLRSRIGDPEMDDKVKKRLSHELAVWKQLDHPNILPLYGTVSDFGMYVSMVCPWLENGSVTRYMERCGDILSMPDRLQILVDVAEGLAYLHSHDIIHGDLSGANILIDDQGRACLCDFGLSSIVADFESTAIYSTISGAVRWADAFLYKMQIEEDQMPKLTTCNDIYSFGSVTLEILSGRIPYHYVRNDAQVVIELHKGNKPRRPATLFVTDSQWAFIQQCWDEPYKRPNAVEVSKEVKELHHRASLEYRRWTS